MADLSQRLSLIVDAAGEGAESTFRRLSSSAEDLSSKAKTSGADVAAAADRVAQARLKEADAYGKLRVEEQRLEDLRNKANATAAQIAAAEERVASAQRRTQAATHELTRATEAQQAAQEEAAAAAGDTAEGSEEAARGLGEYKEAAAAIVGGGLVAYLGSAVTGFVEGAQAAGSMAISMNATVEEAGTLAAVLETVGVESGDILEIQAQFAGVVGDNANALTDFGGEIVKNADGTTNWALTLQSAMEELQKIPDATERNTRLFALFGEEGGKQMAGLLTSGRDVADVFESMGVPFTEEDVEAARQYDLAMGNLSSAAGDTSRTLGRLLLPMVTGALDAFNAIADVLQEIPTPLLLAGAGAVGLGFAMRSAAAEGGLLAGALASASAAAGAVASRMIAATTSTGAFAAAAAGASRAALGLVGGPIGAILLGAGAAYYFASEGADAFADSTAKAARELSDSEGNLTKNRRTLEDTAQALVEQAGMWERAAMAARGYESAAEETGLPGWMADIGEAFGTSGLVGALGETDIAAEGAEEGIKDAAEAVTGFAAEQEEAQVTTATLNDLIAAGTTTGEAFTSAVKAAAEAQAEESRTSDLAAAALDAYTASTSGAYEATLNLFETQISGRDAYRGVVQAAEELAESQDDVTTNIDENAVALDNFLGKALDFGSSMGEVAVANARAAGELVTPLREAQIRADEMVQGLRDSLNVPDLTETAETNILNMIAKLEEAKAKGDIEAILTLTGAPEAEAELDSATEDRDTTVTVESRNGPAVISYLDSIAKAERLAVVRVESRNGPAVDAYLDSLRIRDRLALIRVESRNGPAVDSYIDSLTRDRLAIIRVETRGGPAVDAYLDSLANQVRNATIGATTRGAPVGATQRGAPVLAGALRGAGSGSVTIGSLTVNTTTDSGGRLTPQAMKEAGRNYAAALDAWSRTSGWKAP